MAYQPPLPPFSPELLLVLVGFLLAELVLVLAIPAARRELRSLLRGER
jgi:hypothetical protein